jgi:hypothetical protein
VLEQNPHPVAVLADGLGERAGGEPLEEVALEQASDFRPFVERREVAVQG